MPSVVIFFIASLHRSLQNQPTYGSDDALLSLMSYLRHQCQFSQLGAQGTHLNKSGAVFPLSHVVR